MLEVVALFKFDHLYSSFDSVGAIQFRALRQYHRLRVAQFTIWMELYDAAYIERGQYKHLPTYYPGSLTLQRVYSTLCGQGQYEHGDSKATCLSWPSYRYVYAILSRSVNGHGDSTCVLSRHELLYLYSMVQSIPIHLGHILVVYLQH